MTVRIEISTGTAEEAREEMRKLLGGTAPVAYLHVVEDQPTAIGVEPAGETEEQKQKRKRRTKAEIAADEAHAAASSAEILGVDPAREGADKTVMVTGSVEDGKLTVTDTKVLDPFADISDDDLPGTFAARFDFWQKSNPGKDEVAFMRDLLQQVVAKFGMDAAREFMVANGFATVSKIVPTDRDKFLSAVDAKLES